MRSLAQGPPPEAESWDLNLGLRAHDACLALRLPVWGGGTELTRRSAAASGLIRKRGGEVKLKNPVSGAAAAEPSWVQSWLSHAAV